MPRRTRIRQRNPIVITNQITVLFEIDGTFGDGELTEVLRKARMVRLAAASKRIYNRVQKEVLNSLAEAGKQAIQDTVPIDSGELRDEHVKIEKAKVATPHAEVFIDSEQHTQFGKNKPVPAADLADWLNQHKSTNRQRQSFRWYSRAHARFDELAPQALRRAVRRARDINA